MLHRKLVIQCIIPVTTKVRWRIGRVLAHTLVDKIKSIRNASVDGGKVRIGTSFSPGNQGYQHILLAVGSFYNNRTATVISTETTDNKDISNVSNQLLRAKGARALINADSQKYFLPGIPSIVFSPCRAQVVRVYATLIADKIVAVITTIQSFVVRIIV